MHATVFLASVLNIFDSFNIAPHLSIGFARCANTDVEYVPVINYSLITIHSIRDHWRMSARRADIVLAPEDFEVKIFGEFRGEF